MAKPLRSQLNQIRAWVRQGRTDAWIAHQLEVSTTELREFRRRHELDAEDEDAGEDDLRDEIEAEIEAATREEELAAEAEPDEEIRRGGRLREGRGRGGTPPPTARRPRTATASQPKRRRRRRRGGRGRHSRRRRRCRRSFDHGERGLRALARPGGQGRSRSTTEHWAGKRRVEVTIEPDRIVIKRSEDRVDRRRPPVGCLPSQASSGTLARWPTRSSSARSRSASAPAESTRRML